MAPRVIDLDVMDLFRMEGRSPGKHVSSAIFRIMQKLHPDRFTGDPIEAARAILGNAIEKTIIAELQRRYPDRYVIPGELHFRGIGGTPDLLDMIEEAVVEVKLTWASGGRAEDPEDVWWWRYWNQGRAYCKMIGWRKVIIIVIFINGGYENGGKPGIPYGIPWVDEFSDEDLNDTWAMIEAYAR
jgi:hypothetical protein